MSHAIFSQYALYGGHMLRHYWWLYVLVLLSFSVSTAMTVSSGTFRFRLVSFHHPLCAVVGWRGADRRVLPTNPVGPVFSGSLDSRRRRDEPPPSAPADNVTVTSRLWCGVCQSSRLR